MSENKLLEEFEDVFFPPIVFRLLQEEDKRQLKMWGHQARCLMEWLAYTMEELGELSEAISEYVYNDGAIEHIRDEAQQVATLAAKIMLMAHMKCQVTMPDLKGMKFGDEYERD